MFETSRHPRLAGLALVGALALTACASETEAPDGFGVNYPYAELRGVNCSDISVIPELSYLPGDATESPKDRNAQAALQEAKEITMRESAPVPRNVAIASRGCALLQTIKDTPLTAGSEVSMQLVVIPTADPTKYVRAISNYAVTKDGESKRQPPALFSILGEVDIAHATNQ